MKRLIPILLGCMFALGLLGCRQKLSVPTGLMLSERTVSWNAVEGATDYILKVNDIEYPVMVPTMDLPEGMYGPVALSVKAMTSLEETEYSPVTNAIAVIRLSSPQNLIQDGSFVRWDAVEHATGYVVKLDGIEYPTVETSYEIPAGTSADVQVLAVGRSDGYIVSSSYSAVLGLRVSLAVPGNIRLVSGLIVWDAVEHAVSYVVRIGTHDYGAPGLSIDLRYDYVGTYTVEVMAIADDAEYADSGFGSATLEFPLLTLDAPENLNYGSQYVTFEAVAGAMGYDILVNGAFYASVTTTSYLVPLTLLETPNVYIEVVATSTIHLDSAPSRPVYLFATVVSTEAELRAVTGGTITLAADIALTSPWTPLDFTGSFDGAGYTISNIVIDQDAAHLGFFGILEDAVVFDLTLAGSITVDSATSNVRAGGLAAVVINSMVSNIRIQFTLEVHSSNGIGVAGGVFGTVEDSFFLEVIFQGSIETSWMTTGGFAGLYAASVDPSQTVRCSVIGNVTGSGGEATPTGGFAGMILDNMLEIYECSVWGTISGYGYLGGFVGYLGYGTIVDSYVHGEIEAGPMENASLVVAGGFAGRVEGYNVSIIRCLAIASVTSNNASPDVSVGGFAGVTPGGTYATIYQNCGYSDTSLDRIGNPTTGRGDGITEMDAALLTAIADAAPGIWDFDGAEIRLIWE